MAKQEAKPEPTPEVEAKVLSPEQSAIVNIAASCAAVFELVNRTVPSNHIPAIQKEIAAMKKVVDSFQ
jgi:hypothetical protein